MNRYQIPIVLAITLTLSSAAFAQRGRQAPSENQRKAYSDLIATWADQHLGLTAEQRTKISSAALKKVNEQLERDPNRIVIDFEELLYMNAAMGGSTVNWAVREELNDILTPAQAKVMQLMFPQQEFDKQREDARKMEEYRKAEERILAAARAGRIKREDIEKRLGELKDRIWGGDKDEDDKGFDKGEDDEELAAAREKSSKW